jgi:hypothetical protein
MRLAPPKLLAAFVVLGCLLCASGCVPLPDTQEITPVLAPTRPSLSGIATYGGQPAPGAKITLRIPGWQADPTGMTVAEATTGADGRFAFENPPVGEYSIVGFFADGEQDSGGWPLVIIEEGREIADVTVPLERALALLQPASGAQTASAPTLAWEPFAEALGGYRLLLIDAGTTEMVLDALFAETTVSAPSLTPGRTYTWVVQALGGDNVLLAESASEFTVSGDVP